MKLSKLFKLLVFIFLIFFASSTGNSQAIENEFIYLEVIFTNYKSHLTPIGDGYFYLSTFASMEILTEGYEYIIFCWVLLDENHDEDKYKTNSIFKIKILKDIFDESISNTGILIINNNSIIFIE
jgi:hypothetical protein